MKRIFFLVSICSLSPLVGLESEPWLGNWLEFEGTISQTHTQATRVDTTRGERHHFLHAERTALALEFMPHIDFSGEVELDLAKTERKEYGFEAIKASCRYRLLNDLAGDPVCLTAGFVSSLATPSRVKDLSAVENGVFENEARLAIGKEFLQKSSYTKAWALGTAGIASSGSPWLGLELTLGQVFADTHSLDLFFKAEKGLSHHKLHHISHFHSYSRLGYRYEDLGLRYTLKEIGLGSLVVEATTRLHGRYCPKNSWSVRLAVIIPFAPW